MRRDSVDSLVRGIHAGDVAALARAVTLVENGSGCFEELLARLHGHVGRARRIGITGPPGAGKSTLTDRLVRAYRADAVSVGVIAVDPTSPFSGGAVLGDRVRMDAAAGDEGVFIRSMATRGATGGLAVTTHEVADVLDAFGFERILVESVGVGQAELSIMTIADTAIVVLVPESGDAVQVLKAGVLEVADVFVVNKADRPDAHKVVAELEEMVHRRSPATESPPVLQTVATTGAGVEALHAAVEAHGERQQAAGQMAVHRHGRLVAHTREIVDRRLRQRFWSQPGMDERLEAEVRRIERGETNPYAAAHVLVDSGARGDTTAGGARG